MSGVSNWLRSQKKSELAELAEHLGLDEYFQSLKKADLEVALDEHLSTNASLYSSDSRFKPYYKRRAESSPVKREASSALAEVEAKTKPIRRRVTKAAEDISNALTGGTSDDSEPEPPTTRARSALTQRTPRSSALAFAQNVPLPPSPAVVADAIDRNTAVIRSKLNRAVEDSGVIESAQVARETLSTVTAVQALMVIFEMYFLRKEVLPDCNAFTIPGNSWFRTSDYQVKIPDLFLLLTGSFWGPTMLWLFTTLAIPLAAAYFFNLTAKPKTRTTHTAHFNYNFDPLTFNIAKALMVFVVFGQDVTFGGLIDLEHVARINAALYGGWPSVLVGNGIGVLVTLYEAVLKK